VEAGNKTMKQVCACYDMSKCSLSSGRFWHVQRTCVWVF